MKSGRKWKVGRWIVLGAGIIIVILLLSGPGGSINVYRSYQAGRRTAREIRRLHEVIDSLNTVIARLKNDSTIWEKIAREKLGMAADSETVYKFVKDRGPGERLPGQREFPKP